MNTRFTLRRSDVLMWQNSVFLLLEMWRIYCLKVHFSGRLMIAFHVRRANKVVQKEIPEPCLSHTFFWKMQVELAQVVNCRNCWVILWHAFIIFFISIVLDNEFTTLPCLTFNQSLDLRLNEDMFKVQRNYHISMHITSPLNVCVGLVVVIRWWYMAPTIKFLFIPKNQDVCGK